MGNQRIARRFDKNQKTREYFPTTCENGMRINYSCWHALYLSHIAYGLTSLELKMQKNYFEIMFRWMKVVEFKKV